MKKMLLIILSLFLCYGVYSQNDTIAGWTFPTGQDGDEKADKGLEQNVGSKYLGAEDTTAYPNTVTREITYTNGASGEDGDYSATAIGWDEGENVKLWAIKIKTGGATNLKVSSKQRAGGTNAGPRDFKIQCRISGGEWIDVEGGSLTVGNDWTAGVVQDLPLPQEVNGTSESVFVRWIMTSNFDINDGTINAEGIGKIDDIFIIGDLPSNIIERENTEISIYPNPAQTYIMVSENNSFTRAEIIDLNGKLLQNEMIGLYQQRIDFNQLQGGVYILRLSDDTNSNTLTRKLIIE